MNININNVKIIVTIPTSHTKEVQDAAFEAGAGDIGTNYTTCSNIIKTIGTFKPINNANPYIGEKGKLEIVEEEKLEVICTIDKVKNVVTSIRKAHPYEEPEIDIIPLLNEDSFK